MHSKKISTNEVRAEEPRITLEEQALGAKPLDPKHFSPNNYFSRVILN
jgi:hypothetical protein